MLLTIFHFFVMEPSQLCVLDSPLVGGSDRVDIFLRVRNVCPRHVCAPIHVNTDRNRSNGMSGRSDIPF